MQNCLRPFKILLVFLGLAQVSVSFAKVQVGAALWDHEPSGTVTWQGSAANLESGLNLRDDQQGFVWVKIDHAVPAVPKFGIIHTKLDSAGSGTVTTPFTFGGTTYNIGNVVSTSLNLDQTDFLLYYKLGNSKQLNFDLGLNIKYLDGSAKATNQTLAVTEQVSFKGAVPMLYANLNVELPLTGLSAGIEGSIISYSGSRFSDFRIKTAYHTKAGFGVEGGYRSINLKLDDFDAVSSDFKIKGLYLGVSYKF